MVRHRADPLLDQPRGRLVDAPARQAVDDAGVAGVLAAQQVEQLPARVLLVDDHVAQVGAVERRDEAGGVLEPQLLAHLAAGRLVGGGGERDARHVRVALGEDAQPQVLGAEVVAPLAHAVGLVDRDQRELGAVEQREEARREQPLGRHVEQVEAAVRHVALDLVGLGRVERAVQVRRAHPQLPQGVHLVLHQGDQRADDQADAGAHQRGHLVAQRLAAAGGHEHERVAAGEDRLDDGFLVAAERVVAPHLLQGGAGVRERADGGVGRHRVRVPTGRRSRPRRRPASA